MTHEEQLMVRVEELWRLGDNVTKADIIRHLKEVERETARCCAQIIQEESAYIYTSEVFEGKPMTALEFAQKSQRHILNTFLT